MLTRRALEKKEKLPESLARQYFRDMLKVSVHIAASLIHINDRTKLMRRRYEASGSSLQLSMAVRMH